MLGSCGGPWTPAGSPSSAFGRAASRRRAALLFLLFLLLALLLPRRQRAEAEVQVKGGNCSLHLTLFPDSVKLCCRR